jgi:hypothetical protein
MLTMIRLAFMVQNKYLIMQIVYFYNKFIWRYGY